MCVCEYVCTYNVCSQIRLFCGPESFTLKNIELIYDSWMPAWLGKRDAILTTLTSPVQVLFSHHVDSHKNENVKEEKRLFGEVLLF